MVLLTNELINHSFDSTGVDKKFFPIYEAEVKRLYDLFQSDFPDEDDTPYEESNVMDSIQLASTRIRYYAQQAKLGHCHNWAYEYSLRYDYDDDELIRLLLDSLGETDDKEAELDIYLNSISPDPIFKERFTYLLNQEGYHLKSSALDYCQHYRKCINNGKSDLYARAYADANDYEYSPEYWDVFAKAYVEAINHGDNHINSFRFGDLCVTGTANGFLSLSKNDLSIIEQDWQKTYLSNLIREDWQETHHRPIDEQTIEFFWREKGL